MIRSSFIEPMNRAGRSKYPGRKVYNKDARRYMHMVGTYRNFRRIVGVYSDAFDIFVNELATRIAHDQQNVIIIYGPTGSGKSSLALNLCVALAKKIGTGFDLDKDYIYTAQDLFDKLQDPKANKINLFDEGSVTLSSMLATRKSDRDIVTLFNTMRSKHMTSIICNPTFEKVNRQVREDHCDFRVACNPPNRPLIKGYSRGFFQVRYASRKDFQENTYWPLLYTGVFGDYPEEYREKYLEIKASHQQELIKTIHLVAQTETAKTRKQAEKYLAPTEEEAEAQAYARGPKMNDPIPQEPYLNPPYSPQEANQPSPYTVKRGPGRPKMTEEEKEQARIQRQAQKQERQAQKKAAKQANQMEQDRIDQLVEAALQDKLKNIKDKEKALKKQEQNLQKKSEKIENDRRKTRARKKAADMVIARGVEQRNSWEKVSQTEKEEEE